MRRKSAPPPDLEPSATDPQLLPPPSVKPARRRSPPKAAAVHPETPDTRSVVVDKTPERKSKRDLLFSNRDSGAPQEPVTANVQRQKRRTSAGTPEIPTGPKPLPGDVFDLPSPTWRPKGTTSDFESSSEEPSLAPRRSRTRRRKDVRERDISAAAALIPNQPERRPRPERSETTGPESRPAPVRRKREASPDREQRTTKPEPPPAVVARPYIPPPEDAPQVILRDGVPTLVRDKRVYPPVMFFGSSPDEVRAATVFDELRLAADNGIHLFSHLVELEVDRRSVDEAVAFAGYMLKKTLEIDPEAQVLFRIVFNAPKGWDSLYPAAKYVVESGGLAEPSVCDDQFWGEAEKCLTAFIDRIRMHDIASHILGIHLERGEWFFAEGWGYDTSIAAHVKFRDWVRFRYRNDIVALRAAWFDGQVQFENVSVPEYGHEVRAGEEFVRTGRKARPWVDYHLFLSDTTVERIVTLASAAKKASAATFLIGVSYGYTFEWSHPANGHLSLGKLLRTREVDFIAGPPSYRNREPGCSAPFPCPIDSFALNGKLYISEEDFKTPISGRLEPDDFNPTMKTPQALESVHWRGAGAALAHLSGVCWMDVWGNGWLSTPGIWQRGSEVVDALIQRMAVPVVEPDVAVFIDERSLAYLVDQKAFSLLVQSVREAILRSGLSVGFYLLSDLAHRERFPESKLYVFMNAWDVRPEVRSAIKARLQRDNKVLFWLYAAGLFDGGRDSLERVREITGIALKPQPFGSRPGTTMLNRRHPLCEALPEKIVSGGGQLEPSYFAIPEDGIVLGEYSQTGLPSFVMREFATEGNSELSWKSVFLGEPIVTPALFRALGQIAGAHVWNYHEDVVHVRPPFLTVHCSGAGARALTLPDKWSAYEVHAKRWAATDSTHLRFNATDGSTHLFLAGSKHDIDLLLAINPEEWLRIENLPESIPNTLQLDAVNFDVPIMKLDEWMEESWTDEMAEDLLLKPSQLEIEVEEVQTGSENLSRNRRSGRRRKENRSNMDESSPGRREGADREEAFNDLGMNVVFRKRQ